MDYPVSYNIAQPEKFQRIQIALRFIIVLLFWLIGPLAYIFSVVYLLIPFISAILISQKGSERFLLESNSNITKWLSYFIGFQTYLVLLTDKMPIEAPSTIFQLKVQPSGKPTIGDPLFRIILTLPHFIVLGIVGIPFIVFYPLASIFVLATETYPEFLFSYFRGYIRWTTRVYFYLAAVVEEYPPFSFGDGTKKVETTTPPMGHQ